MGFKKGHKTNVGRVFSKVRNEKIRQFMIGRKISDEHKKKAVETRKRNGSYVGRRGAESNLWKGGVSSANELIRKSTEYKLWRKSVFERDNYTCVWCGDKSGGGKTIILHPDHIKPFAYFPELRFAIDNGRTLCINCHKTTKTYGGGARKYEIHK